MNKNYLVLIIATMMLFSMGTVYAALGVGSWVANDNTSLTIDAGQSAEFRYGITAVTIYNGKYSIMLYKEGNANPLYKYAENVATVGNGALGKFNVTPAHYGNTAGNYYVSITSSDNYGSHSYKLNLLVNSNITPPINNTITVSCNANPSTGYSPLISQFQSTVSGGTGVYTYTWTFGDGTTGSDNAATQHTYSTGAYNTALSIKDSANNTAAANCGQVIVNAVIPTNTLKTSCVASPTTGTAPMTISIVSQTSGGTAPYKYEWTYGDGSVSTNEYKTILSYLYSKAGVYPVSLKVFDANNNVAEAACGIINVAPAPVPLSATCTVTPTSGTIPLNVNMSSQTIGGTGTYKYTWFFGDGQSATTTLTNNKNTVYAYTYNTANNYTVRLGVVDSENNVVFADCGKVSANNVTPPIIPLNVSCNAAPTNGTMPLNVSFTSNVNGGTGIYTYNWIYGDGISGNTANNNHIYTANGTYNPTLQIIDSASNVATANCGNITITGNVTPPINNTNLTATCNANPTNGTEPLQVNFTSTATGGTGPYTYNWIFGDSTTIVGADTAAHVYNIGTYAPTLVVTDSANNTIAASCGQVTVNNNVTPPNGTNMSVSCFAMPSSGTAPLMVLLNTVVSNGAAPYTFSYDYGNGTTSTDQNNIRLITYDAIGIYNPTVVVTDNNGIVGNASCGAVVVSSNNGTNVLGAYTGGPYTGYINEPVTFNASLSSGNIVLYRWNFGDGTTIDTNESVIQHTYNKIDKYTVTLTVYGIFGNSDTKSTTATIIDRTTPPIADSNAARDLPDRGIVVKSLTLFGSDGGEDLSPNDYLTAKINVKNEWDSKLKNVRVTLSIPELGLEARSSPFDFSRGSEQSETIVLPLYDVEPGVYYVRVEVHNDQGNDEARRIKYREIIVK